MALVVADVVMLLLVVCIPCGDAARDQCVLTSLVIDAVPW